MLRVGRNRDAGAPRQECGGGVRQERCGRGSVTWCRNAVPGASAAAECRCAAPVFSLPEAGVLESGRKAVPGNSRTTRPQLATGWVPPAERSPACCSPTTLWQGVVAVVASLRVRACSALTSQSGAPASPSFSSEVQYAGGHTARWIATGFRAAGDGCRGCAGDWLRSGAGRLGGQGGWPAGGYVVPDQQRCSVGDRHRQGCRGTRSHSPLDRASDGLCGEGTLSLGAGDYRPRHRERLLLRFRIRASVHA